MWMSRYLERAESLARLVEVADQLAMDYRHPELSDAELFWQPILSAYGYEPKEIKGVIKSGKFLEFLLMDPKNGSSVFRSLSYARENARGMREQLSGEIWEVLNELYLWCRNQKLGKGSMNAANYGARVRQGCLHVRGLVEEMMPREEAWCFLTLGTMLERADQTSRLLDLKTVMPGVDAEGGRGFEPYMWLCIMRGCGAGSQRGFGNTEADWPRLIQTLVFSATFPRSIRYCVRDVNRVLHNLSGSGWGVFRNEAERACGRMMAELDLGAFSGEIDGELHDYLDLVQQGLIEIGNGIQDAYSYAPPEEEEEEEEPEVKKKPAKAAKKQTQSQS